LPPGVAGHPGMPMGHPGALGAPGSVPMHPAQLAALQQQMRMMQVMQMQQAQAAQLAAAQGAPGGYPYPYPGMPGMAPPMMGGPMAAPGQPMPYAGGFGGGGFGGNPYASGGKDFGKGKEGDKGKGKGFGFGFGKGKGKGKGKFKGKKGEGKGEGKGDDDKVGEDGEKIEQEKRPEIELSPIAQAQRSARMRFEKDVIDRLQGRWQDEAEPATIYTVEGNLCSVDAGDGSRVFRNRLTVYGHELCWDARRFWHYLDLKALYAAGEAGQSADRVEWTPAKDSPPTREIKWIPAPPLPEKTDSEKAKEEEEAKANEDADAPKEEGEAAATEEAPAEEKPTSE